jgi:hypothetical protein
LDQLIAVAGRITGDQGTAVERRLQDTRGGFADNRSTPEGLTGWPGQPACRHVVARLALAAGGPCVYARPPAPRAGRAGRLPGRRRLFHAADPAAACRGLGRGGGRRGVGALGADPLGEARGWWRLSLGPSPSYMALPYLATTVSTVPIFFVTWRIARRFC